MKYQPVVLLVKLFGCARKKELTNSKFSDVIKKEDMFKICSPSTKIKVLRVFYIPEKFNSIVEKYTTSDF